MNKFLWIWILTIVLFLIWSLGSAAAVRNHDLSYKETWVGIAYLITGLVLILSGLFFWIKGIKEEIRKNSLSDHQ